MNGVTVYFFLTKVAWWLSGRGVGFGTERSWVQLPAGPLQHVFSAIHETLFWHDVLRCSSCAVLSWRSTNLHYTHCLRFTVYWWWWWWWWRRCSSQPLSLLRVCGLVWSSDCAVSATWWPVQSSCGQGDGSQARCCCMRHGGDCVSGYWVPQGSQASACDVPACRRTARNSFHRYCRPVRIHSTPSLPVLHNAYAGTWIK